MSLGDYPVGVDTLGRASDNFLKIFPEVVRSEVGIKVLGGQVAQVLGVLRIVVAADTP